MKTYLVGGAIRDELLGRPVTEKDWVVVGSTAEQMQSLGFQPVGNDFPVFLHPETKEEYALARTERKTGPGYKGFHFYAAKDVSLEQDLLRRDLTINAIAQDSQNQLIDPFNGQQDIRDRVLRHVSPAFSEDPVRILRIARFAARYHHLGFTIAPETMALMTDMVNQGEVDALVAERVWKETHRALAEQNPSVFFYTLRQCGALKRLMPELDALFGIPQNPEYHPEIDTGVHVMMTIDQTAKLNANLPVRFATLLHDLGKAQTPHTELPHHPLHAEHSPPLVKALCKRLGVPKYEKELALAVALYHIDCHKILTYDAATVVEIILAIDGFRRPQKFADFLLSCEADSKGRAGSENTPYPNRRYFWGAFQACKHISSRPFVEQGLQGAALGIAIKNARIDAVEVYIRNWHTQKNNIDDNQND